MEAEITLAIVETTVAIFAITLVIVETTVAIFVITLAIAEKTVAIFAITLAIVETTVAIPAICVEILAICVAIPATFVAILVAIIEEVVTIVATIAIAAIDTGSHIQMSDMIADVTIVIAIANEIGTIGPGTGQGAVQGKGKAGKILGILLQNVARFLQHGAQVMVGVVVLDLILIPAFLI